MIGVSGLMNSRECMYWQDEIAASNGDTRKLWRTLKGVLSDHGGEDVSVHKGVLSDHGGEDVSVHTVYSVITVVKT